MNKISALLLALLIVCALGVVSAQHTSRALFVEMQEGRNYAEQLEEDYRQLQVDQSTWATHSRIEKIARQNLRMNLPQADQTRIILTAPAPTVLSER